MKKIQAGLIGLLLWGGLISPVMASSIPKAEIKHSSIAVNLGPSFAVDLKLSPQLSVGGSAALPIYYLLDNHYGIVRYDVRMAYKFMQEGAFSLSVVAGVWGDSTVLLSNKIAVSPVGLELGLALAFEFVPDRLIGRLNIVPGLAFMPIQDARGYFPPAGGIELAYRVNSMFEVSIGANGNGDLFGARLLF